MIGGHNILLDFNLAALRHAPRIFDRDLLRRRLDKAAQSYAEADFLKGRAAGDLVMRLEAIMRDFPRAVDLGACNGAFAQALTESDATPRVGLPVEAVTCSPPVPRSL